MSRRLTEIYAIQYGPDEITAIPSACKQMWNCTCDQTVLTEPKCGYTPEELQQRVVQYYQQRVDYLRKLTPEQFMHDLGFYHYGK